MAILKNPNKDKFTVIDNFALRDNRLSLKARGLLVTMLSLPDNWKFSENGLCSIFEKDGQAAIRSGLKELEEAGYLVRERVRDEHGRVSSVNWIVYDKPQVENPSVVTPNLEEQPQLNTKELNTDSKKELKNTPHNPQTGMQESQEDQKPEEANLTYCKKVVFLFGNICKSLQRPTKLTDSRMRAIKKRRKEIIDFGGWEKFFKEIESSDFLSGRSGEWKATFDWVLKPSNALKIMEGNYKNQNRKNYKNNTNCNNSQKFDDSPVTEYEVYGD